jgi:hypothetical protein
MLTFSRRGYHQGKKTSYLSIVSTPRSSKEARHITHASSQQYFIVDSVEALNKFSADAWDRVVEDSHNGQVWQIRPYKWSEPRLPHVLLHHGECLAVYR